MHVIHHLYCIVTLANPRFIPVRLRFLLMHTFWMDTHSMETYWWDTCWTDTYWWDTYCKPADANVLNAYALHGYVLVGYVLNGYVWDMCGVMDMCGICVVWAMCGICVVWDTPTIFWRTLRRNVFREKSICLSPPVRWGLLGFIRALSHSASPVLLRAPDRGGHSRNKWPKKCQKDCPNQCQ